MNFILLIQEQLVSWYVFVVRYIHDFDLNVNNYVNNPSISKVI